MNRDLLLVLLSLLTWGVGEGMFLSFEPLYLEELGADPVWIGAILGAMGLAMAAAQAPAGYLADRFGRKPIMVTAWYLGIASTGIMAFAGSLPVFVIGLLIYGLTAWVITPLASYVTSARGTLSVGRVLTLVSATYHGGAILGPLLGGWIGDQWGLRYTFVVAFFIFILSTMMIVFIRPQGVEPSQPGERRRDLFKNVRFLRFLGVVLVVMVVLYLPQPLSPNFLQNERGIGLGTIGQLLSIGSIGIVVLNLLLGHLPAHAAFVLGQAAVGGFALLLWKGTGFPWFAAGYFLLGGFRLVINMSNAQVRELVSPANMGLAYGLTTTVALLSSFLAPPIAGLLYHQDPGWIYPISASLIGCGILLSLRLFPKPARQGIEVQVQTSEVLSDF